VGFKNPPDQHCAECPSFNKEARKRRLSSPQHQRSILIKKIDDAVSLVVRIRGNWTCIKCHTRYPPVISRRTGLPAQNLMTSSHYFGRGKMGTRWELEDLDPMDIFCHQKVENAKKEDVEGFNYEQYMIQKIGVERLELLRIKSEMYAGYSIADLLLIQADWQRILRETMAQYEYH